MSSTGTRNVVQTRDRSRSSTNGPSIEELRRITHWIRDDLDPLIAHEGCHIMEPDAVLALNQIFNDFLRYPVDLRTCQQSRIHKAILLITTKGTRWPKKLIEMCDAIVRYWHLELGPLDLIRTPLYGQGGRLKDICRPEDLNTNVVTCISDMDGRVLMPGDWWIAPHFAFRSGMIDEKTVNGGITFDENGAYAILMTESDEVHGKLYESNLASCTYRTRCDDRGRYILSKPDAKREPVRVLRSHKLVSLHSPKVGVRYDGLYKVTGWIISTVESVVTYDIRLARLEEQISIEKTCTHPDSEEVEDYMEYKRIRAVQRTKILDKRFVEVETTSLKETSSSAVEKPSDFPPLQQPIASSGHTNALIFDNTPSVAESDAATQGPQKSLLNTLLNRSMTVWKRQISTGPSKRDSLVEGQMEVSLRGGGDDSDAFECTSTGEQLPEDGRTDSLMEDRANNFAEAIGDGALTEYCSRRRTSSMLDEANSYQVDDFGELQAVDPSDDVAPAATRPHSLSGTTCVDEFETHISGRSFPVSMSNEVDGDNWDPRAIPGPSHGSYQLERNDRLYAPAFADSPVASPELLPRARSSSAPGVSKTLTFEGLPKPASYEETRSKSQGTFALAVAGYVDDVGP